MYRGEKTPHDPGLMAWDELNEIQQSLFIEGCNLFNDGKFWHAHEAWEDLWKSMKPLGKRVETDALVSKESIKEDRKDERTRIQASQQSELIDQRKTGKPPKKFESTSNDILSGDFDLGMFDPS